MENIFRFNRSMEKELEDMDTTNPFVKDLHREVAESVKVSLKIL